MLQKFLKKNFSNAIKIKLQDVDFHRKEDFKQEFVTEAETTPEEMIDYYK